MLKTEKSIDTGVQPDIKNSIISDADVCVRCGFCLPHCPTYNLTKNESESPRGRIAIAKAYAENKIALTGVMYEHLDHCLSCQACEAMCPVNVPYSHLIDNTQALLQQQKPRKIPIFLKFLINFPQQINLLTKLAWFYQTTGLRWLLRKTKLLNLLGMQNYDKLLPDIRLTKMWKPYYEAIGTKKADVALFLGCVNRFSDNETLNNAIQLLNIFGYGVYVPSAQTCCGAIDLHQGNHENYQNLEQQNQQLFTKLPIIAVIGIASGCSATLKKQFNLPVMDISDFLLTQDIPELLLKNTIDTPIIIHTPCSLRNVLKSKTNVKLLLEKLGFTQVSLLENTSCCGAAGMHMWHYPDTARAIAQPLIEEILSKSPQILLSSNIGCLLHLTSILREKDQSLLITHPINVIFQEKIRIC